MTTTLSPRSTTHLDHPSVADRVASGKAARAEVPRTSHGDWAPASDRPDPLELLAAQERTRVPELVPIRHGRMAASPFAFYRGAANVLASDLANQPRTSLQVQLCGDAHLVNFGGFASPERSLVFDVNDFDETLPGPFEWDVKRLAASMEVAARGRGFNRKQRATHRARHGSLLPRSHADLRRHAEPRPLVRPPRHLPVGLRSGRPGLEGLQASRATTPNRRTG